MFKNHLQRKRKYFGEREFVKEILGDLGEKMYKNAWFIRLPLNQNIAAGLSLPSFTFFRAGTIWLSEPYFSAAEKGAMRDTYGRFLLIHEVYHQMQYNQGFSFGVLLRLVSEFCKNKAESKGENAHGGRYVYAAYKNVLHDISVLDELEFLESQAELVGIFAAKYFYERYAQEGFYVDNNDRGILKNVDLRDFIKMAKILKNSGIDTEATRWVLENITVPQ
jgi:hypothetical protein